MTLLSSSLLFSSLLCPFLRPLVLPSVPPSKKRASREERGGRGRDWDWEGLQQKGSHPIPSREGLNSTHRLSEGLNSSHSVRQSVTQRIRKKTERKGTLARFALFAQHSQSRSTVHTPRTVLSCAVQYSRRDPQLSLLHSRSLGTPSHSVKSVTHEDSQEKEKDRQTVIRKETSQQKL